MTDPVGRRLPEKTIEARQAIELYVQSGMTVMVGGFGLVGAPLT